METINFRLEGFRLQPCIPLDAERPNSTLTLFIALCVAAFALGASPVKCQTVKYPSDQVRGLPISVGQYLDRRGTVTIGSGKALTTPIGVRKSTRR